MEMTLSETPGSLKRFRQTPWRYQQTFRTPLKNLQPFVAGILSCIQPIQKAIVTFDKVIFEPRNLNALIARKSIAAKSRDSSPYLHDWSLSCGGEDAAELLTVALQDWLDFLFVPTPKPFVIFADHDEYSTFFAVTKSHLNRVVSTLADGGFRLVHEYQRQI
ncbi:MAG: hypothetical protein ABSF29_11605 [Tepidisphaeraceae bacterium]|jgi:hypothetical protein